MKADWSNYHGYNRNLQRFARKLRNNGTKAEACLWKYALRAGKMKNFQFRRQRPVLNYIADFLCKELMLVIEVDGITHTFEEVQKKDQIKQRNLEKAGFTVLRFTDDEVLEHFDQVYGKIERWVVESGIPPPPPRQRGKRTRRN